jgi:kynurenine formamidase
LGRLNLLTPSTVLRGIAEAKTGEVFSLSLPLDFPGGHQLNPRRHPPVLRPTLRDGLPNYNFSLSAGGAGATDVICDDLAILHLQYSTQWDGLAHVGSLFDADDDGVAERVYYNGYRANEHIVASADPSDAGIGATSTSSANALGIEHMAATGVQGRGVMIDLHSHFGNERTVIGYRELMRVLDHDHVEVLPGDMVCLHTGFAQLILEARKQPAAATLHSCAVLDGQDPQLLQWITDSGLAVLIADNHAVEARHSGEQPRAGAALPLHEHCLFKLGIHLGEMWHLTPLARWLRTAKRYRFLLTAPPLRLPGAVGSPLNPVATM